ncbi:MAG: FeoB-associated Cys-rich membrane protein [Ruminococcus sp.]|nr:FeoB-associated Cys-rich membrane protein [Candidatus Apopatosoma intestinale]
MNVWDYLLIAVLLACVVLACRFLFGRRKKGGCGCSSCDGCCENCRLSTDKKKNQ